MKPVIDNGFGGKEYEIEKKRIRPPRAPVILSFEARAKLIKRMKEICHRNALCCPKLQRPLQNLTRKTNRA